MERILESAVAVGSPEAKDVDVGSIPFWKKHDQKDDMARVSAILKEPTRQNGMLPRCSW
ncbi:MAG: hypothetical protein F6K41_26560 [Symploca sp. SIO3E6]|nr:hypothetical protein [Caldora sp. SIO3E6]